MPRVRMIDEIEMASPSQVDAFEHIVASRGKMLRLYAAMIHRPEIARAAADLGAVDDRADADLVDFVRKLCRSDSASEVVFERCRARFGDEGVVELAATVGYYSMMAVFMNACEVC